jgi:tRNA(fMet)-specific endonuclease VapC
MEMICLDTNLLIDHKRAKQKDSTKLYQLSFTYKFAITTITAYELLRGDNSKEDIFWSDFFSKITILDFSLDAAKEAGRIYRSLKSRGMMIDIEDILIGGIALANNHKVATNNKSHFSRIEGLELL